MSQQCRPIIPKLQQVGMNQSRKMINVDLQQNLQVFENP